MHVNNSHLSTKTKLYDRLQKLNTDFNTSHAQKTWMCQYWLMHNDWTQASLSHICSSVCVFLICTLIYFFLTSKCETYDWRPEWHIACETETDKKRSKNNKSQLRNPQKRVRNNLYGCPHFICICLNMQDALFLMIWCDCIVNYLA